MLGLNVMAVVTLTESVIDTAETGFALESAMLTEVALVTFALRARVVRNGTRSTQAWRRRKFLGNGPSRPSRDERNPRRREPLQRDQQNVLLRAGSL